MYSPLSTQSTSKLRNSTCLLINKEANPICRMSDFSFLSHAIIIHVVVFLSRNNPYKICMLNAILAMLPTKGERNYLNNHKERKSTMGKRTPSKNLSINSDPSSLPPPVFSPTQHRVRPCELRWVRRLYQSS